MEPLNAVIRFSILGRTPSSAGVNPLPMQESVVAGKTCVGGVQRTKKPPCSLENGGLSLSEQKK